MKHIFCIFWGGCMGLGLGGWIGETSAASGWEDRTAARLCRPLQSRPGSPGPQSLVQGQWGTQESSTTALSSLHSRRHPAKVSLTFYSDLCSISRLWLQKEASESQKLLVGFLIFSHEVGHSVTPVVGGGVKTSDSDILTSAVARQPQTCVFQNQIGKNIKFSKLGQLRRKLH